MVATMKYLLLIFKVLLFYRDGGLPRVHARNVNVHHHKYRRMLPEGEPTSKKHELFYRYRPRGVPSVERLTDIEEAPMVKKSVKPSAQPAEELEVKKMIANSLDPVLSNTGKDIDLDDPDAAEMINSLGGDDKKSEIASGDDDGARTKSDKTDGETLFLDLHSPQYKHFIKYDPSNVTGDDWSDRYDAGNDIMELTSQPESASDDIMAIEKSSEQKEVLNNILSDEARMYDSYKRYVISNKNTDTSKHQNERHTLTKRRRKMRRRRRKMRRLHRTDANARKRSGSPKHKRTKKGKKVIININRKFSNGNVRIVASPNRLGKLDLLNVYATVGDGEGLQNDTGSASSDESSSENPRFPNNTSNNLQETQTKSNQTIDGLDLKSFTPKNTSKVVPQNNTATVTIGNLNVSVANSTELPANVSQVIKVNSKEHVHHVSFCETPELYGLKLIICKKAGENDVRNVASGSGDDEEEIDIDTNKIQNFSANFDLDLDDNSTMNAINVTEVKDQNETESNIDMKPPENPHPVNSSDVISNEVYPTTKEATEKGIPTKEGVLPTKSIFSTKNIFSPKRIPSTKNIFSTKNIPSTKAKQRPNLFLPTKLTDVVIFTPEIPKTLQQKDTEDVLNEEQKLEMTKNCSGRCEKRSTAPHPNSTSSFGNNTENITIYINAPPTNMSEEFKGEPQMKQNVNPLPPASPNQNQEVKPTLVPPTGESTTKAGDNLPTETTEGEPTLKPHQNLHLPTKPTEESTSEDKTLKPHQNLDLPTKPTEIKTTTTPTVELTTKDTKLKHSSSAPTKPSNMPTKVSAKGQTLIPSKITTTTATTTITKPKASPTDAMATTTPHTTTTTTTIKDDKGKAPAPILATRGPPTKTPTTGRRSSQITTIRLSAQAQFTPVVPKPHKPVDVSNLKLPKPPQGTQNPNSPKPAQDMEHLNLPKPPQDAKKPSQDMKNLKLPNQPQGNLQSMEENAPARETQEGSPISVATNITNLLRKYLNNNTQTIIFNIFTSGNVSAGDKNSLDILQNKAELNKQELFSEAQTQHKDNNSIANKDTHAIELSSTAVNTTTTTNATTVANVNSTATSGDVRYDLKPIRDKSPNKRPSHQRKQSPATNPARVRPEVVAPPRVHWTLIPKRLRSRLRPTSFLLYKIPVGTKSRRRQHAFPTLYIPENSEFTPVVAHLRHPKEIARPHSEAVMMMIAKPTMSSKSSPTSRSKAVVKVMKQKPTDDFELPWNTDMKFDKPITFKSGNAIMLVKSRTTPTFKKAKPFLDHDEDVWSDEKYHKYTGQQVMEDPEHADEPQHTDGYLSSPTGMSSEGKDKKIALIDLINDDKPVKLAVNIDGKRLILQNNTMEDSDAPEIAKADEADKYDATEALPENTKLTQPLTRDSTLDEYGLAPMPVTDVFGIVPIPYNRSTIVSNMTLDEYDLAPIPETNLGFAFVPVKERINQKITKDAKVPPQWKATPVPIQPQTTPATTKSQKAPPPTPPPKSRLVPNKNDTVSKYRMLCKRDAGCIFGGTKQKDTALKLGKQGKGIKVLQTGKVLYDLNGTGVSKTVPVKYGLPTQGISVNSGGFTPQVPVVASKRPPNAPVRPYAVSCRQASDSMFKVCDIMLPRKRSQFEKRTPGHRRGSSSGINSHNTNVYNAHVDVGREMKTHARSSKKTRTHGVSKKTRTHGLRHYHHRRLGHHYGHHRFMRSTANTGHIIHNRHRYHLARAVARDKINHINVKPDAAVQLQGNVSNGTNVSQVMKDLDNANHADNVTDAYADLRDRITRVPKKNHVPDRKSGQYINMVLDILSGKNHESIMNAGNVHHYKHFMKYNPENLSNADWGDDDLALDSGKEENVVKEKDADIHIKVINNVIIQNMTSTNITASSVSGKNNLNSTTSRNVLSNSTNLNTTSGTNETEANSTTTHSQKIEKVNTKLSSQKHLDNSTTPSAKDKGKKLAYSKKDNQLNESKKVKGDKTITTHTFSNGKIELTTHTDKGKVKLDRLMTFITNSSDDSGVHILNVSGILPESVSDKPKAVMAKKGKKKNHTTTSSPNIMEIKPRTNKATATTKLRTNKTFATNTSGHTTQPHLSSLINNAIKDINNAISSLKLVPNSTPILHNTTKFIGVIPSVSNSTLRNSSEDASDSTPPELSHLTPILHNATKFIGVVPPVSNRTLPNTSEDVSDFTPSEFSNSTPILHNATKFIEVIPPVSNPNLRNSSEDASDSTPSELSYSTPILHNATTFVGVIPPVSNPTLRNSSEDASDFTPSEFSNSTPILHNATKIIGVISSFLNNASSNTSTANRTINSDHIEVEDRNDTRNLNQTDYQYNTANQEANIATEVEDRNGILNLNQTDYQYNTTNLEANIATNVPNNHTKNDDRADDEAHSQSKRKEKGGETLSSKFGVAENESGADDNNIIDDQDHLTVTIHSNKYNYTDVALNRTANYNTTNRNNTTPPSMSTNKDSENATKEKPNTRQRFLFTPHLLDFQTAGLLGKNAQQNEYFRNCSEDFKDSTLTDSLCNLSSTKGEKKDTLDRGKFLGKLNQGGVKKRNVTVVTHDVRNNTLLVDEQDLEQKIEDIEIGNSSGSDNNNKTNATRTHAANTDNSKPNLSKVNLTTSPGNTQKNMSQDPSSEEHNHTTSITKDPGKLQKQ